jgi:hypothetical protein
MGDKLLIAFVAAISAILGGLITSVIAPLVKHRLDHSREELQRKRLLLAEWRKMIADIAGKSAEPETVQELLQNHPSFLSLEAHLSDDARRAAYARSFTAAAGVHIPYPLHVIKKDIIRIERAWGVEAGN